MNANLEFGSLFVALYKEFISLKTFNCYLYMFYSVLIFKICSPCIEQYNLLFLFLR